MENCDENLFMKAFTILPGYFIEYFGGILLEFSADTITWNLI